jgi:hypothetical protein
MIEVVGGKGGFVASYVALWITRHKLLGIFPVGPVVIDGYHGLNFWAADSDPDAQDIVMADLMEVCPPEKGWFGHRVRVARVDTLSGIPRARPKLTPHQSDAHESA